MLFGCCSGVVRVLPLVLFKCCLGVVATSGSARKCCKSVVRHVGVGTQVVQECCLLRRGQHASVARVLFAMSGSARKCCKSAVGVLLKCC